MIIIILSFLSTLTLYEPSPPPWWTFVDISRTPLTVHVVCERPLTQSRGYQNKAYLEMHYDFAKKYGHFTSKAY